MSRMKDSARTDEPSDAPEGIEAGNSTDTCSATFEIVNRLGMHARAATKLVQLAGTFECDVELEKDGERTNAKSVMGVLLLCGHQGARVKVVATGKDAKAAVEAIGELIADRFGEPD